MGAYQLHWKGGYVLIKQKQNPTKKERKEEGREGREKKRARERKKTQYMSRFQISKSVYLDSNLLSVAPSLQYEAQDCLKMTLRIWLLRH